MRTDRETINELLKDTHFVAIDVGQRVCIEMIENGKAVCVDDGTSAQIIDFLKDWHCMNARMQAALAEGSIFL